MNFWDLKIRYATVSQQVELITGHSSFKRGWLYLLSESSLSYVYAVGGSLQSWYQRGFLRLGFTVSLPSPPSLYDTMDPVRVEEDREAVTSFYETFPLLFDGTRRTVPLAAWLYDMESIFSTSHIQARLQ
ncbi:hypothetical protein TIFTF001_048862, partial [Ficus carica]